MRISAKIDYACRALLELSLQWPNAVPLQVHEIAQRRHIPTRFLIHILIQLKQWGVVRSLRGKSGGYALTMPPEQIRLGELIRYFDGSMRADFSAIDEKKPDVIGDLWQELDGTLLSSLNAISFSELCRRERSLTQTLLYQI